MRSSLSASLILIGVTLGCVEPELPQQSAELSCTLLVSPPFAQRSLPLWRRALEEEPWRETGAALSLLSDEAQGSLGEAQAELELEERYGRRALWRSLSALELPRAQLSMSQEELDEALERLCGGGHCELSAQRPLAPRSREPLLYPLFGLDYRSRAIPLIGERALEYRLSPWSLLTLLLSPKPYELEPARREALRPLIEALEQRVSAWVSLSERLALSGPWQLPQLMAQLAEAQERDALRALSLELALSTLSTGGVLSPEQRAWLRALPCLIEAMSAPELATLTRALEEAERGSPDPSCALPSTLAWLRVEVGPGPQGAGRRLELSAWAESFDQRPLELSLQLLSAVAAEAFTPPHRPLLSSERRAALDELSASLGYEELEGCSPERESGSASLRCSLSWRGLDRDELTLLLSAQSSEGVSEEREEAARLISWRFSELPSWGLTIAALSRPSLSPPSELSTELSSELSSAQGEGPQLRVMELALSAPLSATSAELAPPPLAGSLTLDPAGLATLELTGSAIPLSAQLALSEAALQLWSPFPPPGRWREPFEGERLSALISPAQLIDAPSLERLEAEGEPLRDALLLTPLTSALDVAARARSSLYELNALEALQLADQLSESVLELLGAELSPTLNSGAEERLRALSEAPEGLAELLREGELAQAGGWSERGLAQLRVWLCFEAASAVEPHAPELLTPTSFTRLNSEWLEWLGLGCLIAAQSLEGAPLELSVSAPQLSAERLAELLSEDGLRGESHLRWLLSVLEALSQRGPPPLSLYQLTSDGAEAELGSEALTLELGLNSLELSSSQPSTLLHLYSATGLKALSLRYLEAPWLEDDSSDTAPRPFDSARLLDERSLESWDSLTLNAIGAPCLWERPSLVNLPRQWRLDSAWRSAHPLSDPRWLIESDGARGAEEVRGCQLGLLINHSALPRGRYLIELTVEPLWAEPAHYNLRFELGAE